MLKTASETDLHCRAGETCANRTEGDTRNSFPECSTCHRTFSELWTISPLFSSRSSESLNKQWSEGLTMVISQCRRKNCFVYALAWRRLISSEDAGDHSRQVSREHLNAQIVKTISTSIVIVCRNAGHSVKGHVQRVWMQTCPCRGSVDRGTWIFKILRYEASLSVLQDELLTTHMINTHGLFTRIVLCINYSFNFNEGYSLVKWFHRNHWQKGGMVQKIEKYTSLLDKEII